MDSITFLVANSVILTAQIGQVLTAHHFNAWQVVRTAAEVHYLAAKLNPSYVIIDVAMVESDLGRYCNDVAEKCGAAIILIRTTKTTLVTVTEVDAARARCEQIIAVFEFPLEVERLVRLMTEHRNSKKPAGDRLPVQFAASEGKSQQNGVADWIKEHPDILTCAYLSSEGQVVASHGMVEPGQSEAAHYILAIGRSLGENLGFSHVLEAYQHGPEQKFLTLDDGNQVVTFQCKPKANLRAVAERFQT
jgi:chemotaxis response regulator CheB